MRISGIEALLIIIGSFIGLALITTGVNIVIPFEHINPYTMVIIGAVILLFTGTYAISKK